MLQLALGFAAASWAIAMALSPAIQIRLIVQRESSAGVSVGYMLVLLVGFALWFAYGVASHDLALVVPNVVALAVMAVTIAVVRRYR